MSEHQPSHESLDAIKATEHLQAPERHEVSQEQIEANKNEQQHKIEEARTKLEHHAEVNAKMAESDKTTTKHHPTRFDKESAYWNTLRSVQMHLSPVSRQFSKVIHNPTIEKASELIGQTVARPSVLMGATTTAALLSIFLYIIARIYGFSLSGSELLLSLIVGAALGLVVEGLSKLVKRH